MADIFDYLTWRGDLSFADVRPCEVDCVILSMVSYLDYDALCGGEVRTITEAARNYCTDGDYERVNLGLIMPSKKINRIFCDMGRSKRFGGVRISDFESRISREESYQFGAVTFHVPGKRMIVIFRGTDDTVAGWHEDCCLAFMDEIPAQRMAVEYLERMAEKYPDERIYVAGHSKGGNLAAYALINCNDGTREQVVRAFCLDGPGLSYSMIHSDRFKRAQRKLSVLLPQSSFVGTMFEKGERYTVVQSSARGLLQHDPFTWVLEGPAYIKLPALSDKGKKNEEQFREGMQKMSAEEKKRFVDTLFDLVASTGAETLTDFADGGIKKLVTLVKGYGGLDKQKRDLMLALILKLFDFKKERSET